MLWKHGSLTPELADLVFTFLPLDLSVADEDDVLVYWKGDTYKSCDARFIGRDVRDCHPESSMDCLEEILRAFKAGEKDVAEGWEEHKGKFKRTRYFALRDHDNNYKGILEVNEDVTRARALEGEQALPGW
ncbi:MAG TPA: PAS domain-containing protein [Thermoleophilia bacterium]|nr:PAS domain-containing protein [Thermoleophilia bacterium]